MNIQIKEPCREGWNNMSVVDKGRFCDACQRTVHDFTNATAEEIKRQYELNNGKLCGHVPGKLLTQQFQAAAIRKGYFHNLKVFCWAALLSFGAGLFTVSPANAKSISSMRAALLTAEKDSNLVQEITIKGVVTDKSNKEALPFVTVNAVTDDTMIINTCMTDVNGVYELKIPAGKFSKVDVKCLYVGYVTEIVKGISVEKNAAVSVEMEQHLMIDGEMVIIKSIPKEKKHRKAKVKKSE